MRYIPIIVAFLLSLTQGQYVFVGYNQGATVAIPGLVNFRGMPNNEGPLAAKVSNGCATDAYCTWYVDPVLSGNTGIVFYEYQAASGNTANIPTISDDQSNTYTHCGTDSNQSANDYYIGCYYKTNITNAPRTVQVTWTAAVKNVSVATMQLYNVTAKDGYNTNNGTGATTFSSGSITPSGSGDEFIEFACGTSTVTNVGAWTVGSQSNITWAADVADRRDACMIQRGVYNSSSALNPQLTTATSNNYAALGLAFTAGSQGTAPTGMYIAHLYTVNTASSVNTSNPAWQVPVSGNLIVGQMSGAQPVTGISDTVNSTWTPCNQALTGGADYISTFYKANISSGLLSTTVTVTGTGDVGPARFYDIAGAATTQLCSLGATTSNFNAASTVTALSTFTPSSSAGIVISGMSQAFNTSTLASSPAVFDCNFVGGQSISGPSVPDQNNGCSHYYYSSNANQNIVFTQSATATAVQAANTQVAAFQAPSATLTPSVVNGAANSASTSGTTVALTSYVPYQAGDSFAVIACTTVTTGTISVSDTVNTYTTVDTAVNNNGNRCQTFDSISIAATTVTITATFGTTNTFRQIYLYEMANVTGLDKHNIVASTSSSSVYTGTALTTTHANEVLIGFVPGCSNCNVQAPSGGGTSPGVTTSPWSQTLSEAGNNGAGYRVVNATGSYGTHLCETGVNISNAGVVAELTFF